MGTLFNILAVVAGSLLGLTLGHFIPRYLEKTAMQAIGLCTIFLGVTGFSADTNPLLLIISMVLGAIIGTALDLDGWLIRLGEAIKRRFSRHSIPSVANNNAATPATTPKTLAATSTATSTETLAATSTATSTETPAATSTATSTETPAAASTITITSPATTTAAPAPNSDESETRNTFAEGFVTATLLWCVGAMTIIGCIKEGIQGDASIIYAKSTLDLISSTLLASTLGVGVLAASASVLCIQGTLTLLANQLAPWFTEALIRDITCTGSLLLVALGLNLIGLTRFKVMNYAPALLLPVLAYCCGLSKLLN